MNHKTTAEHSSGASLWLATIALLIGAVIYSWLNTSYASHLPVKLSPVEEINPEPADKSAKMEKSTKLEAKRIINSKDTKQAKSSLQGLWSIFWSHSKKPASFHFIDIIEILE